MIPAALRRRRYSLLWLVVIGLLALLLGALATIPLLRAPNDGSAGTLVGQPAPALDAEALDRSGASLDDAAGRLVWVNFWAVSCEPCRTEMPAMQRLSEAYTDELLVLGVNWGEERGAVEDFVERYGIEYPILLDPGLDNFYRWAGADGLPRHYFVGEAGTILREVIGPLDPARMVEILDELLVETAKAGSESRPSRADAA
ncbi:MAG TPA: TlpA disulfide reductase family protein [Candidatus Binatia bacterium]|nr:TlpA disulfide reductase family protein [Candidatus Binatia bacterium]